MQTHYTFGFETVPKIICLPGASRDLSEELQRLNIQKVLLVTDQGLMSAGVVQPVLDSLADTVAVELNTDVEVDPPQERIEAAIAFAQEKGVDGVIGLGGGSSMDTAKLIALLAQSEQSIDDVYGVNMAKGGRLPLVLIPTTAGTGSEVTTIAIVTTPTHEKKGVVSPLLLPDVAVLDAEHILNLPASISAMTGIDAMVHAIESYTSILKKNPITDAIATKALKLLYQNLDKTLTNGHDLKARSAMLLGACLAGMAIANAPVGAVHALAYPLGGHFHMPHGHSNALVLPGVLEFNASHAQKEYAELARLLFLDDILMEESLYGNSLFAESLSLDALIDDVTACQYFIQAMTDMVKRMPFSQRLSDSGVAGGDLDMLARDAVKVERLLQNNPRDMTYEAAYKIYQSIL